MNQRKRQKLLESVELIQAICVTASIPVIVAMLYIILEAISNG